jgi:hypothetical protein
MSRCARNLARYTLPETQECRRGRRHKYGEKAKKLHEWLSERSGWSRAEFMIPGRMARPRCRVQGPFVLERAPERPVCSIVVKSVDRRSGGVAGIEPRRSFWSVPNGMANVGFALLR